MKILHCEQSFGILLGSAPVTLLTDSSISRNHRPLFLPPHHDSWVMTISPAIRVSRLGKFVAPKFARRYYDAFTLVARLRPATGVTIPASAVDTAFDSSVVIGDWLEIPSDLSTLTLELSGAINREIKLDLDITDDALAWLSTYFMIKHGDIIIPGDLPDTLSVAIDTSLNINVNSDTCLNFKIK